MKYLMLAVALSVSLGDVAHSQDQTSTPQASPRAVQPSSSSPGIRAVVPGVVAAAFYAVSPADMLASQLVGLDVHNLKNEEIGEIEDLIIDDGKQVRAVVVSVGGFLGVGERYVALKPASIIVAPEADDGTLKAVVNTTREELKGAPEFHFGANMARTEPKANQQKN